MLLNMMVEMTSWMPRVTFSSAGTRAQSAPPSMPARTTTGTCSQGGSRR